MSFYTCSGWAMLSSTESRWGIHPDLEIIMKDNHTLGNNPNNAVRWVEITRQEIEKVYG